MEINMDYQQLKEIKILNLISKNMCSQRYERKFSFDPYHIYRVMYDLNNSCFFKSYDNRRVTSIYFDTNNFICYSDNINGENTRLKIRLRKYNNDKNFNLEYKIKKNNIGYKLVVNRPYQLEDSIKLSDDTYLKTGLITEPKIQVTYDREYLFHEQYGIKATIDHNILFNKDWLISDFSSINESEMRGLSEICSFSVLEFKYDINLDSFFKDFVNTNFRYVTRFNKFSKYIMAFRENNAHFI
jgi:hypothetical protein